MHRNISLTIALAVALLVGADVGGVAAVQVDATYDPQQVWAHYYITSILKFVSESTNQHGSVGKPRSFFLYIKMHSVLPDGPRVLPVVAITLKSQISLCTCAVQSGRSTGPAL